MKNKFKETCTVSTGHCPLNCFKNTLHVTREQSDIKKRHTNNVYWLLLSSKESITILFLRNSVCTYRYLMLEQLPKSKTCRPCREKWKKKKVHRIWRQQQKKQSVKCNYGVSCNKFRNKQHASYTFLYQKFLIQQLKRYLKISLFTLLFLLDLNE